MIEPVNQQLTGFFITTIFNCLNNLIIDIIDLLLIFYK